MNIFKLFGTIAIRNKEALDSIDETTQAGDRAESKLSGAFSKIGSAAVKCGKVIASGLAVGAAAFSALTIKSLNLAGELEQNMGGSEAVFGKYAKNMQKTAETAFSSMGLSASDFLGTANKMGSLFKGAGFDAEEASELTATAMQRAADVASIMGIDVSVAMESIAGAAKGNFTMLDNLGVAMNDTNLQAYALSKGIDKSTQEMTSQEKIGLAMQMFLEKTADYAGNYAKENETLAGSLTTAKAALKNFLSGAGDAKTLGDALVSSGNVIATKLTELLPHLVTGITNLINQLIPQIPPLLEKTLPGIIQGAVVLIKGLAKALPGLVKNLVTSLFKALGSEMAGEMGNALETTLEKVIKAVGKIINVIGSALEDLMPVLVDVLGLVSDGIDMLFENQALGEGICDLIDSVINLVKNVVSVIKGFAEKTKPIVEFITTSTGWIFSGIAAIIDVIADAIGWLGDFFGFTSDAATAAYELSDAEREIADQAERAREKHKELMDEFSNEAQTIEDEAKRTKELWEELKKCIDANGNVLKGHEERAAYIVGEFSRVSGIELEIINGQVKGYQTLASEIDNVIRKKQAEGLLTAYQGSYDNAVANREAYRDDFFTASDAYDAEVAATAEAKTAYDNFITQSGLSDVMVDSFKKAADTGADWHLRDTPYYNSFAKYYRAYNDQLERENDALEERNTKEQTYLGAIATIYRYETATSLVAEGRYQEATNMFSDLYVSVETYKNLNRELTDEEIANLQTLYDKAERERSYYWDQLMAGTEGFTAEEYNEIQSLCVEMEGMLMDALSGVAEGAEEAGENVADGFADGMESRKPNVIARAGGIASAALDAMRVVAQIKSPSRVTRGFGHYIMEGLALGIDDEAYLAIKAAEEATNNALDAMTAEASSISFGFDPSRVPSVDHVISGAVDTKQELRSLIESLPDLITYAISNGLKLNINNREFGRMVKAVT